jgi:hypothetical protein
MICKQSIDSKNVLQASTYQKYSQPREADVVETDAALERITFHHRTVGVVRVPVDARLVAHTLSVRPCRQVVGATVGVEYACARLNRPFPPFYESLCHCPPSRHVFAHSNLILLTR